MSFETDCWDTHAAIDKDEMDFVPLDVRTPHLDDQGHVPRALNLAHGRIIERNPAEWPPGTASVVYCAGPHCNGAEKMALRPAEPGRHVKKMIGGMEG